LDIPVRTLFLGVWINVPKIESSNLTKYWIRLLLLVGCIVGFFALIGMLLPRSFEFRSEIEIDAPPAEVFATLNQLSTWQTWSHWNRSDLTGFTLAYSGSESGVGATQAWTEPRGSGKLWITVSEPDQRIEYESLFANFPKMTGTILLTPINGDKQPAIAAGADPDSNPGQSDKNQPKLNQTDTTKTKIVWTNSGRLPSGPTYGYLAPFFSGQMQYVYDNSLLKLKLQLEGDDAK